MAADNTHPEFSECAGTRIYRLDNYLTSSQCESLVNKIKIINHQQGIFDAPVIAQELWQCIGPKLSLQKFYDAKRGKWFVIQAIGNNITITNSSNPTPRHKDARIGVGDNFKLAFYLNQVPAGGGTIFFHGANEPSLVKNKQGSGVLFDLDLEHEGEKLPCKHHKVMIGARPMVSYFQ